MKQYAITANGSTPAVLRSCVIAEITFAIQIRTWHGRGSWTGEPRNKVLVATWLASEMWIDPWLLLAGVANDDPS